MTITLNQQLMDNVATFMQTHSTDLSDFKRLKAGKLNGEVPEKLKEAANQFIEKAANEIFKGVDAKKVFSVGQKLRSFFSNKTNVNYQNSLKMECVLGLLIKEYKKDPTNMGKASSILTVSEILQESTGVTTYMNQKVRKEVNSCVNPIISEAKNCMNEIRTSLKASKLPEAITQLEDNVLQPLVQLLNKIGTHGLKTKMQAELSSLNEELKAVRIGAKNKASSFGEAIRRGEKLQAQYNNESLKLADGLITAYEAKRGKWNFSNITAYWTGLPAKFPEFSATSKLPELQKQLADIDKIHELVITEAADKKLPQEITDKIVHGFRLKIAPFIEQCITLNNIFEEDGVTMTKSAMKTLEEKGIRAFFGKQEKSIQIEGLIAKTLALRIAESNMEEIYKLRNEQCSANNGMDNLIKQCEDLVKKANSEEEKNEAQMMLNNLKNEQAEQLQNVESAQNIANTNEPQNPEISTAQKTDSVYNRYLGTAEVAMGTVMTVFGTGLTLMHAASMAAVGEYKEAAIALTPLGARVIIDGLLPSAGVSEQTRRRLNGLVQTGCLAYTGYKMIGRAYGAGATAKSTTTGESKTEEAKPAESKQQTELSAEEKRGLAAEAEHQRRVLAQAKLREERRIAGLAPSDEVQKKIDAAAEQHKQTWQQESAATVRQFKQGGGTETVYGENKVPVFPDAGQKVFTQEGKPVIAKGFDTSVRNPLQYAEDKNLSVDQAEKLLKEMETNAFSAPPKGFLGGIQRNNMISNSLGIEPRCLAVVSKVTDPTQVAYIHRVACSEGMSKMYFQDSETQRQSLLKNAQLEILNKYRFFK